MSWFRVTDRTVFMSIPPKAAPNVSGYLIKCKTLSLTVHVILNMVKLQNFVPRFLDGSDVLASNVKDSTIFMNITPKAAPNVLGYFVNSNIFRQLYTSLGIIWPIFKISF